MTDSIAQHPILWLLAAFLAGALAEWILEMFVLRQRLFEAEDRARRRSEELDSERFHHGRTQADLRVRLGELDAAVKGRSLAESLLQAARAKLTTAETEAASARATCESALALGAQREHERDDALRDLSAARSEHLGMALQLEALRAEARNRVSAVASLQNRLAQTLADAESGRDRLDSLDAERQALALRVDQQAASLEAARKELSRTAEQLDQVRGELAGARARETASVNRNSLLEQEASTLTERLRDSETRGEAAARTTAALEQKLKARSEEIRLLSGQLGEASEELSALRQQVAQSRAQLDAAAASRASLERDLASRELDLEKARRHVAEAAAQTGTAVAAEVADLQEALAEERRAVAAVQSKAEELEAELLAITRAHQEAVRRLEELEAGEPGSAESAPKADQTLAADLEVMTRERNELAAELAVLRAARRD